MPLTWPRSTKTTYLVHVDRFVRWLAGEVVIASHSRGLH